MGFEVLDDRANRGIVRDPRGGMECQGRRLVCQNLVYMTELMTGFKKRIVALC